MTTEYEVMAVDELEQSAVPLQVFFESDNELAVEYENICRTASTGTFECFTANAHKNRYSNIVCYDHSRVKLPLVEGDPASDYINANYVDGYKQKGAFISTQGPLTSTFHDFWRMIWSNKCHVIVMLTKLIEGDATKCDQYWPGKEKTYYQIGNYRITNEGSESDPNWAITTLKLTNTDTKEERTVVHMQFTSWPDFGVPSSPKTFLKFRNKIRDYQKQGLEKIDNWRGHPLGPPIVVHCSAGVGRTGTFITIDITIQRLEASGLVDIKGTVEKTRSQRALSVYTVDQYIFCFLALIEYARMKDLIEY